MTPSTPESTVETLARAMREGHRDLSRRWLERLNALLAVPKQEVFPSPELLDHVPDLILEIAEYLRDPDRLEIAANTKVMAKAAELGELRFDQRASVHQLLREYQILAEILEESIHESTVAMGDGVHVIGALLALGRAAKAVRVLQQQTVDAFVIMSTDTIHRQTAQLRGFSRLVSHEIRQPLGVLQVLARIIPVREGDEELGKLVATLDRNVVRLGDVAGKLERLTRLTRHQEQTAADQTVDVGGVARDVVGQLADMAAARGVTITVADPLPVVASDAGRLELVLMNLFANAIKYSDPAKSARHVELRQEPAGDGLTLCVSDNGIGIPQTQLEAIFGQFVRVHEHMDDELDAQGLGLGLSIVRECMEALGGRVTVESQEGHGTCFSLMWPAIAHSGQQSELSS